MKLICSFWELNLNLYYVKFAAWLHHEAMLPFAVVSDIAVFIANELVSLVSHVIVIQH